MTATQSGANARLSHAIPRLIGAQGGVYACMSGLRMAIPLLALKLGHGTAIAGMLVALFGVAQLLATVPASWMADRFGLKFPVLCGAMAAFIGAMVVAARPELPWLGVAAFFEGAAVAIVIVAVQREAGRLAHGSPGDLRRVFSWTSFTPAASNFLGPLLAGIAIDFMGFRAAFFLMGIGPCISYAFVRGAQATPLQEHQSEQGSNILALIRDKPIRSLMMINWFVAATWDVHTVMVPHLALERGLNASTIGAIFGAMALAAALIRLAMPWIGRHFREWVWVSVSISVAALVLGIYPFASTALAMAACALLLGAAIGSVQPMVMSMLHQLTPSHQHRQTVAMRLVLVNISSISTPAFAGMVGGLIGPVAVFWIGSGVLMIGVRLATGLRHALTHS